jgi:dTDP-4-amino-4,6-dideoxygalactose transaminase
LAAGNEARRAHARLYDELLADEPRIVRPTEAAHRRHVFHIYAVRVPDRDGVLQRMASRGVNCGVHYPIPIHLQKAYGFLGLKSGSFPVAERCAREFLSLPMYPELRPSQIEQVASTLKDCLTRE